MKRRQMLINFIVIFLNVSILFGIFGILYFPVKRAIHIQTADTGSNMSVYERIGNLTTFLCEPVISAYEDEHIHLYEVIGVKDDNGNFDTTIQSSSHDPIYLTLSHDIPIGNAIMMYNWGFRNQFVLTGTLEVPENAQAGLYNLTLDSWDIVYPIKHYELYIGSSTEYLRNHIIVIDYIDNISY